MKKIHIGCSDEGECTHQKNQDTDEIIEMTKVITKKLRKTFENYFVLLRHNPRTPEAMTSTAVSFMSGVINEVGTGWPTVKKRNEYFDHIKNSLEEIFDELKKTPFEE